MACASALDELINCQICFELFVDPQSLFCRHVFCNKCVNKIKSIGTIRCPVCKIQSKNLDIKPDYRTVFMVDSYLINVTKEASVTEAKDDLISKCEECEQEGKEISHKCENCDLLLCEKCKSNFHVGGVHIVNAISSIASDARIEINTALTDLKAQKEALATKLSKRQNELDNIKQTSDNAITSITEEENSLIAKIKSNHDNLKKEVELKKAKHVKKSKQEYKNMKVYYHDVNDKEVLINSWVSNRCDLEIVNTMEQIQKKLKAIEKKSTKIQQCHTSAENFTVKVIVGNEYDWNGSTKLVISTHPTVSKEEIDGGSDLIPCDKTTAEHREDLVEIGNTQVEYKNFEDDELQDEEYLDEEDLVEIRTNQVEYPNFEDEEIQDDEYLVEIGNNQVEYLNFDDEGIPDEEDLVEIGNNQVE